MTGRRRLRRAVALTFPVAFALHDLEEVLVAGAWGRSAPERIRARYPRAPVGVLRAVQVTTFQMGVAVGVVGLGVAVATGTALRRLDGDLGLLPPALIAFAGHEATHLLASAAYRRLHPGRGHGAAGHRPVLPVGIPGRAPRGGVGARGRRARCGHRRRGGGGRPGVRPAAGSTSSAPASVNPAGGVP